MRRLIFTNLLTPLMFLILPTPIAGHLQNESMCTLTISESPAIRGIKLGMSVDQLLSLFPGSHERDHNKRALENSQAHPNFGIARLGFQPSEYSSAVQERFAGISWISVVAFDGQITEIMVSYQDPPKGPRWPHVDLFIAKLVETFGLPDLAEWLSTGVQSKTLKCSGFELRAGALSGGSFWLINRNYIDTWTERTAADEERKRKEFKP